MRFGYKTGKLAVCEFHVKQMSFTWNTQAIILPISPHISFTNWLWKIKISYTTMSMSFCKQLWPMCFKRIRTPHHTFAFEQWVCFISVPYLLWHDVSSDVTCCLFASYNKPGVLRTYSNPDPHGTCILELKPLKIRHGFGFVTESPIIYALKHENRGYKNEDEYIKHWILIPLSCFVFEITVT